MLMGGRGPLFMTTSGRCMPEYIQLKKSDMVIQTLTAQSPTDYVAAGDVVCFDAAVTGSQCAPERPLPSPAVVKNFC